MKSVVIIGGGIAGVEAAIYYRKEGFEVELISDRSYVFIYPIAIWIPVKAIRFENVAFSLDKIAMRHGFKLTVDRVVTISGAQKTITLENGGEREIDHLVIATGAAKMKHEGLENTLSICGDPEQSLLLKEKIDLLIAKGSGKIAFGFGGNPNDPSGVRGGPAFELFFNLHHRLKKLGIRDKFEMTFFAPMAEPGARMGQKALSSLEMMFQRNNFKTRYGKKIKRFDNQGVIFEDESRLESDLTMFIPAGNGSELIRSSDLPQNSAGFIRITNYCEIENVENWYAIGDAAALEGPDWKAKQGHIAEVMARNAAHNSAIAHGMKFENKKTYQEHLTILCVMDMGNGAGFVYRDDKKTLLLPLPIIGHWLKIGWGWYYKLSKMEYIPRIPWM
ncbi:MAG: sulfide:quinone reductase [Sulfuricurvum sp. RIFOXYD2_FULL_44_160]|uniref:Sulfide:quinone reductase n=1 Tax=Sulfuricurvum kujiense TaxID=148813 RepID=A0A2D3WGC9_9BACT|nr:MULTISPECIES: FAD-dependent oxidoreductase [Sulfuricurvum]OHD91837.1 MAG: sulfide:quinone reductase [Sulfuricurvum sp. RIFOXYD12_FULL_44_77]OHD98615.1 MAG: sulfide:quinone reductase [Sulfuricurvum sp. RIFOXYD2_FULL_44_160]DAB38955.1 MAG TPA: sulfide:quinone reductase [Sulfuricurvum kujiense]